MVIKTTVELVAGAGFAGRPSGYRFAPVAVVCRLSAQAQPACQPRTLGDTARKNAPQEPFCFAIPTSHARRAHNPTKKQTVVIKTTVELVAGAGFEPTTFGL